LKEINPKTGALTLKKISAMNFYKYRIMIRENPENHLLRYGQLFNQFIVDAFVKIETERLRYIRCNQSKLRVENYIHLKDAFFHDEYITNTGQKCILLSTYIGSPRHMHEYIQDALIYVRSYGRPCLFITVTCNSQWDEIT